MGFLAIAANIILVLAAIVLIGVVLLQPGKSAGLGAITGGAETFFGKNKARSLEGKLATATKICAGILFVFSLLLIFALSL